MAGFGAWNHMWLCSWVLYPCLPVAYFILSLYSHHEDSKCHWFLSPKIPKALIWTLQKEKEISFHTLSDTELHKTHPRVNCTPFMIYITIRNQRSRPVKNVSLVWKSSSLGLGIDGERVNGNDSSKRFLISF